jgi:transcriptional regulator with XRE-family HTH domain
MATIIQSLAQALKDARSERKLSQQSLAEQLGPNVNRTTIARLEQGKRVPSEEILRNIAEFLSIPNRLWEPFLNEDVRLRIEFEGSLSELTGRTISLQSLDTEMADAAERLVLYLFKKDHTSKQLLDTFNRCLVFYGIPRMSLLFFDRFLGSGAFSSTKQFNRAVRDYQKIAIRLYSTFHAAYQELNSAQNLNTFLEPLKPRATDAYRDRTEWDSIELIRDERLPDLGYISAARVAKENTDRQALTTFLIELADKMEKEGKVALTGYNQTRLRKMDSLLRHFGSRIEHGLLSPLFAPDSDALRREAQALAPKEESEVARIGETQQIALRNLANYLTADHLDVYVATSMRSDADFVSVNRFVNSLFNHEDLRRLKLRYFNPTQSWIEDRVAKGLVEALMLKRADFTIYMAQKEDTFGKDSEASVSLGQGKPVIVFVPKLVIPEAELDTETLGRMDRVSLQRYLLNLDPVADIDETIDNEGIFARILEFTLQNTSAQALAGAARRHWADFDLYGEAVRIEEEDIRREYRSWLDTVISGKETPNLMEVIKDRISRIFVATSVRFERRARVFREIHPLALQVILSSGVLNGILVSRSVESCASLLSQLIHNNLSLDLAVDDDNYRLIETSTGSTVRVISRHVLLGQAFDTFYGKVGSS